MIRPIESVVAEAQQRLAKTGHLDVPAFLSAYPEHAAELQELLPVMLTLQKEKAWETATRHSQVFATGLFKELAARPESAHLAGAATAPTIGELFAREQVRSGRSLDDEARRTGMPVPALKQLAESQAPLTSLENNRTIKELAVQVGAPFSALVKEVRRLLSLQALSGMSAGAVFTRDRDDSTDEERQALLNKVRKAAQTPPEDDQP